MLNFIKATSLFQKFLFSVLLTGIFLMSSHLWHQDVLFHTDVARDFLVLQEIVQTKSPTLIGPRSGGIPGVFHGPLWYYVNLIPFVIVNGNPVMMGWFWWLLGIIATFLFLYLIYKTSKNLTSSLLATLSFAFLLIPGAAGPINTYLADLFSFYVFIIWLKWYKNPSLGMAFLGWLCLGILVQFQMAFAIPIAVIWAPIFIWKVYQEKKLIQLLSPLAFLPPLASFFIFDLRHDWLQTRSIINYLQADHVNQELLLKLIKRGQNFIFDGLHVFGIQRLFTPFIIGLFLFFARKSNLTTRIAIKILAYWYVCWWLVTLLFSGDIWNYYFSQFFGPTLFVIGLIASKSKPPRLFLAILTIFSVIHASSFMTYSPSRFDSSSWVLLTQIAKDGLSQPNTGYFLYSQDQFAYPLKYAFSYYRQTHQNMGSAPFEKRDLTVLVKAADDPRNPYSTSKDWQLNKVRINQNPIDMKSYPFGYVLEKYILNQENLQKPVDPNMITDLHFR